MEYLKLAHILAAIVVLYGGFCILSSKYENKPLKLLSFFLVAYMLSYIEDSLYVWPVEMFLIFSLIKLKKTVIKDCRWYLMFYIFACVSLSYSKHPIRGIPGLFMYVMPLFYYALATTAIRTKSDVTKLFTYISNATLVLLVLGLPFYPHRIAYPYYGMAMCSIPAILYLTTKKKIYIIHFIICMLPAIFWVKRTPLLGITVGMIAFSLLLYRWKAVIPTFMAIIASIALIISIPSFKEKMTGGDSQGSEYIDSENAASNINTNGRIAFWMLMIDKYYEKAPYIGAGQGSVKAFLQSDQNEFKRAFPLMHNDWLLLLCEIGIIGTSFLLIFFGGIIRKCIRYSSKRYPKDLRLMAVACAASVFSTMTHMFFENCMNSFTLSTCLVFCAIFNYYIRSYQSFKQEKELPVSYAKDSIDIVLRK
ncbi:O-antigen ligase [Prevotella sp. lc2012]|uniref:O-antigen ligase family protein n=1 Tax=Prevotella sp. lc2012 TaxID=1761886 RepID=UPI0008984602|nr:O-antigen ligase family protein [Prevotella sp. lc2012]SEE52446.1 O-antigen ligase like membrane protein [Prevotella sp. lc2012]